MMTPERLAEIRERVRFLAEPGDRDPALIEHLRTTTAASAPKAVFDAEELLAEVDHLHAEIDGLAEKYDKEKIKDEFDCCGCSKPWVLYDEVMRNIRKLVGRDVD